MEKAGITMLFDGNCPICRREACQLGRRSADLVLEDIAAPGFNPSKYGLTQQQVMDVLHVVMPDGRVRKRMDAVRTVYEAAGIGWMARWTKLPGLRQLMDVVYQLFAKNRNRIGNAWRHR